MAVTLIGTNGLFTRLGKLFFIWQKAETLQTDLATEIDDVLDEYTNPTKVYLAGLGDKIEALQVGAVGGIYEALRTAAEKTIIEMVDDDIELPSKTLYEALLELIDQMDTNSDSVDGEVPSIGVDTTGANNVGDGAVLTIGSPMVIVPRKSQLPSFEDSQVVRTELVTLRCIADAQLRGTAGRETFQILGEQAQQNPRHPGFPGGSGVNATITVTDPTQNAQKSAGKNILNNSCFDAFTTNTPDNWTITVGSAGTHVLEEATVVYRTGSKALEIVGDGSNLTAIQQSLNNAGGSTGYLKPNTVYMFVARRRRTTGLAAGVLRISVKDAADTIKFSSDLSSTLSALSDSAYQTATKYFATGPDVSTSTYKVVVELTTAITSGESVYIDDLCLIEMTQHGGPMGPYFNLIRGATDFVVGDYFIYSVSNSHTGEIQRIFDEMFGLYQMGLQLPYNTAGTETVLDSLIA